MERKKWRRKLATLTPDENHNWEYFFSWYLNNGFTESQVDRKAWKDLQAPRLKKYQGLQALTANPGEKKE
jgi:hypothetical protein